MTRPTIYPCILALLGSLLAAPLHAAEPGKCAIAGDKIHWLADWCMSEAETDDEIAAGPCIEKELGRTFGSDCAAKLHYKKALCEKAIARGDRKDGLKGCLSDRAFAGSTVRSGGAGGEREADDPSRDTDESVYVAQVSCTGGPYRPKLPASYQALRKLAKLKREKVHDVEDFGSYKVEHRSLRFVGLEVFILTYSNQPDRYVLSSAILTTPAWRFGGQLRVGAPAQAALKGFALKRFSGNAEIELNGKDDSIRVTLAGGRVQEVEYDCHTG